MLKFLSYIFFKIILAKIYHSNEYSMTYLNIILHSFAEVTFNKNK